MKLVDFGASDEARTRYLHLGKVALYQMSYTRNNRDYYNRESKNVKYKMKKFRPPKTLFHSAAVGPIFRNRSGHDAGKGAGHWGTDWPSQT